MKKIIISFLVITLVLLGVLIQYEPMYHGSIKSTQNPFLFAHRGFGNEAPDNSLTGARLALQLGVAGVDVDAQLTKDGEVVIFHDVSVDRFTTGTGRVDSHTYSELQQYDLGKKYEDGSKFGNEKIATFSDFVEIVTPTAYLMTELKVATAKDTGIEKKVIDTIARYDAFEKVFISSFNPIVLYRLESLDPRVQTVFIFQDSDWDDARVEATAPSDRVALPWYLQTEWTRRVIRKIISSDALSINEKVDAATIERLLEKGWPIFLWSLNTPESLTKGVQYQPFGIITDEPTLASTTLNNLK
jgi:glycerophosphoryl diester phosphodiesterase